MKVFILVDKENIVRCMASEEVNLHRDKLWMKKYHVECRGLVGDEYIAATDTWIAHPGNYPPPSPREGPPTVFMGGLDGEPSAHVEGSHHCMECGRSSSQDAKAGEHVVFAHVFDNIPRISLCSFQKEATWVDIDSVSQTGFTWYSDKKDSIVDWIAVGTQPDE